MTAAAESIAARTPGRIRTWLSLRHSLGTEALLVLALYGLYELARGLVVGDTSEAVQHARDLVALESTLHVFVEGDVQNLAHALPGLVSLLSISYLTLHLTVTAGVLIWLHQHRPAAYPLVRTTLMLASALALVGYLVYPTAPPRMAGIGIADTVSRGHIDLDSGLVSSLYNPFAAVPSMHIGYALVIGASLFRHARRGSVRFLIGLPYPLFVLLVVVATGNHFLFDAFAGALVGAFATGVSLLLASPINSAPLTRFPDRRVPCAPAELTA
jgi:PAP2 superfamily